MGALQLVELVGPTVADHVGDSMAAAFPDRFHAASPTLRALAARGDGPITDRDGAQVHVTPEVAELLDRPGGAIGHGAIGHGALGHDALQSRILRAVADEVTALLTDGTVADARDVDLCLLLGAGWPAYLGGITPELRRRALLP
jgi:3-hydroxyacyl-CoA dehydrogenase